MWLGGNDDDVDDGGDIMTVVVEWRQQWQMDREVYIIIIINTDGVVWQTTRLDYFIIIIFVFYYTIRRVGSITSRRGVLGKGTAGAPHINVVLKQHQRTTTRMGRGAITDNAKRHHHRHVSYSRAIKKTDCCVLYVYINGDANTTVCPPLVGRPGKFITANSEAVSVIRRVVQCKGNQSRSPIIILLVVVHSGPVSLGYIYEGVFAELTYSVRRNVGTSSSFTHRSDPPDPWRGIIRVYWIFPGGGWMSLGGLLEPAIEPAGVPLYYH